MALDTDADGYWLRPPGRPLICGHRGNPESGSENTLVSFCSAFELGVDAVECDLRASIDGELFICHGDNKRGRSHLSLPAIELRRIGQTFFDDLLELRQSHYPDQGLVIDVKTPQAADLLLADIPWEQSFFLISFSDHVVRLALERGWPAGLLDTYVDPFIIEDFLPSGAYLGANFYQTGLLSDQQLARSFVGGVDDPMTASQLAGRGVWALNSNRPALLKTLFP